MENGPYIDVFPIKTSIYEGFSMAMLNNQRVIIHILQSPAHCSNGWQQLGVVKAGIQRKLGSRLDHGRSQVRVRVIGRSLIIIYFNGDNMVDKSMIIITVYV